MEKRKYFIDSMLLQRNRETNLFDVSKIQYYEQYSELIDKFVLIFFKD